MVFYKRGIKLKNMIRKVISVLLFLLFIVFGFIPYLIIEKVKIKRKEWKRFNFAYPEVYPKRRDMKKLIK